MNKTYATLAFGALLSLGTHAGAQDAMPAMPGMTPMTSTDRQFLIQDAQGSVADYANGAAGLSHAQSPAIRQFSVWLLEDHNRLNIGLFMLAQRKGVDLPLTIADADKAKLNALVARKGADFDREFLRDAIQTNQSDISDAKKELGATTDPEVRLLVEDYLSTEIGHLTAAQTIMGGMGK